MHAILGGLTRPFLILITGTLTLTIGCGAPAPEPESTAAEDSGPIRLDMDKIFPPGLGRDLVLNNCQTCHVWVPIVTLRMNETPVGTEQLRAPRPRGPRQR